MSFQVQIQHLIEACGHKRLVSFVFPCSFFFFCELLLLRLSLIFPRNSSHFLAIFKRYAAAKVLLCKALQCLCFQCFKNSSVFKYALPLKRITELGFLWFILSHMYVRQCCAGLLFLLINFIWESSCLMCSYFKPILLSKILLIKLDSLLI